jgi:hypothetical protein
MTKFAWQNFRNFVSVITVIIIVGQE